MSPPNSDRLRAWTQRFLEEAPKSHPIQEPISPIFHNFPWLPTPPMAETLPDIKPVELPRSKPLFEMSDSTFPEKSDKVIYADVWLTESPPPYSFYPPPPSPALSAMSFSSDDSNSTMYSAKSHISQSSQSFQSSQELTDTNPSRTTRSLKRKQAPQDLTLRQVRAKESEAELRKMYEQQTDAYLEELFCELGSPIPRPLSVIRE
jgi:hypothetical protein